MVLQGRRRETCGHSRGGRGWDEQKVALRHKHHHRQDGEPVGRPNQNGETQGAPSCAL